MASPSKQNVGTAVVVVTLLVVAAVIGLIGYKTFAGPPRSSNGVPVSSQPNPGGPPGGVTSLGAHGMPSGGPGGGPGGSGGYPGGSGGYPGGSGGPRYGSGGPRSSGG